MVRLAYGVVAGRDLGVWAAGPDGVPVNASRAAPGTAVVVGPRGSDPVLIAMAVAELTTLVGAGGVLAAGAGIELGNDLRTARLAGAGGDRRDAVLAALPALGAEGYHRLGDRTAVLVALFGPSATRPVGAAATAALHDGRWGALQLASAVSDLLGPEQLERVLQQTGPATMDGLASVLAGHLDRVLGPLSKPRRLTVLLSLGDVLAARRVAEERRERVIALGADDRSDDVRACYQRLVDEEALETIGRGHRARAVEVARWTPREWHWHRWLNRTMHDAWAATLLARTAIAVSDHGLDAGIDRLRPQLAAGPFLLTKQARKRANRRVEGLADLPARPGVHVRDLYDRLRGGAPMDAKATTFVQRRLARARDYAVVVLDEARELLRALSDRGISDLGQGWTCEHLRQWRDTVGYSDRRPPQAWAEPTLHERGPSLARRLRESPDRRPEDLEQTADLLWLGELADVVAQFAGHPGAEVAHEAFSFTVDIDPPAPPADPLRPSDESFALAAAGAAQLVDLGADVPARPRGWTELVDALLASTVVAESLTGSFAVPPVLSGRDGTTVPGTEVTVEIARGPHQLADWARYMGNCIAGSYYVGQAKKGRSVLIALREPTGRIRANLEVYPHRTGWRVGEFRARFNHDPDSELDQQVSAWVAALPPARPARPVVETQPHGHGSVHRPQRRTRVLGDLRDALVPLATRAMAADDVVAAIRVLSDAGSGAPGGMAGGMAGVTALRRARRADIEAALHSALSDGTPDLLTLWRASAVRPLATAVGALDEEVRERYGFLDLLLSDGPMHVAPRRLARVPAINGARTVELVARRLRRAMGRLARSADPVLAGRVSTYADTNLLCALVLAVSTAPTAARAALRPLTRAGETVVPGFPPSTLDDPDGPWVTATNDAIELGAELPWPDAPPALLVPGDWLGRGGWPALWGRAHRASRR